MNNTLAQLKANQTNAQKSTGPVTEEGKKTVANNALKHGLFSKQLILKNENETDYQLLHNGLQCELKPVGTLEQSLVERIAVTLWRQRRLVNSETAHINLSNQEPKILKLVNSELDLSYTSKELKAEDLTNFDQEQLKIYKAVVEEFEKIDDDKVNVLTEVKAYAPLIYQTLAEEAETDEESFNDYIKNFASLREWIEDLVDFYQSQIKIAQQRPLILEIASSVQNKQSILQGKLRDALAKYQLMLDNELYKAIKTLRETQTWRLDILEPMTEKNGFVLENKS
ncbi:hypothetical protein AU255_05020 [Methyloprofundus sedimenti]|uniref:Uncharacterized protein n=1 Tax=Methyloprofundus sedimenti TaxID=1420851 RepID=A0A1V8M6X4_9GAMM|nr:hypothetical protein [Methyloprofundus sedimenti]OQK17256.1 hypothetical protein AU255_05020 [Methyloprofundus sedimenti]